MTIGVTVKKLQEVLASVEPPKRLIDPKTEIPLWDKETMDLLRNATSIAEAKIVDNRMREIMIPEMDQVFENIYIGNYKAASTIDFLKSVGITHVFNTACGPGLGSVGKLDAEALRAAGIEHDELRIRDNIESKDGTPQAEIFAEAAEKIEKMASQPGAKVGVNCFGGFSRSTCSVVAYMVLKKNMQADEALRILKAKRDVHPSAQNLAHLARLSNFKHGFESDPADLEFDLAEYRKLSQLPGGSNDKSAKK